MCNVRLFSFVFNHIILYYHESAMLQMKYSQDNALWYMSPSLLLLTGWYLIQVRVVTCVFFVARG